MRYPNVVRAVTSAPWAILPEQGAAMLEVLELRLAGRYVTDDRIAAAAQAAAQRRAATPSAGAIAVIPVYGVIAQRMSVMMEMCGGSSTEQIGAAFDAALASPQVAAIVLDVDSPGGSVSGVPELATKIRKARGEKPIVAVANSLMASAAYWIGSAADEVVATPSADVGSIGVYQAHLDASEALAEEGLRYTLISAGKYKVEGNPYEPLSDEARAAMQGQVDEWYGAFVNAVAKHRGASAAAVRDGYGEGRVLTARQALAAGMVDRVATLDDVLAELAGGRSRGARRSAVVVSPGVAASADTPEPPMQDQPAGDEAPADADTPPLDPAPQAEEHTVSQTNTAAPHGAVTEPAPTREAQLRQLAKLAGKDLDWLDAQIAAGTTLEQAQAAVIGERREAAQPAATASGNPRITGVVDRAADRPFASFGEQVVAVVQAGTPGGRRDPRLARINAAASGMNESVGSEGGFFIEPELLPGVMEPVYTDDPLLSRVTRVPIGAGKNAVKYNIVDETSRATGSRWGGIQMYWAAEADTATASKPKLREFMLELKKLIGIAYLTEELAEDAPAAESLLTRAFQAESRFVIGNSIFRGTGAGQPLGFLNSGAVVSQAIESAQTIANTAASISTNVTKMLARVPASLWGQVIWLYNQELLPYFVNATNGSSGAVPLFMAAGGLADRPSDTILGRPAFASELCEAVGTVGDLIAIVPAEYHMADKGGPQQASSVHVRFLYDEMTLKITLRTDGAPIWRSAVTPFKGAATRSPFVTLAARS